MEILRPHAHLSRAEVDRRMRHALTAAAQASGPKSRALMAAALERRPKPSLAARAESDRFFGGRTKLMAAMHGMAPMIYSLEAGMPGFSDWLNRSGYGDDLLMIRALLAWIEEDPDLCKVAVTGQDQLRELAAMDRPADTQLR